MLGKVKERYGEGRVDRPSLKSELGGENRLKTRERMLVIVFDREVQLRKIRTLCRRRRPVRKSVWGRLGNPLCISCLGDSDVRICDVLWILP